MLVECLTRALLVSLLLLVNTMPDEIDRDVAMRGVEHISYYLTEMTAEDQVVFRETLRRLAEEEPEMAEFYLDVPRMMGMG
jgi:hypothetical protein